MGVDYIFELLFVFGGEMNNEGVIIAFGEREQYLLYFDLIKCL